MFKLKLQVGNLPSNRLALTNKIYISTENMTQMASFYAKHDVAALSGSSADNACHLVSLNGMPFAVEGHAQVPNEQVAMNGLQRRVAKLSLATAVTLQPLVPYPPAPLASIVFAVDTLAKSKPPAGGGGVRTKTAGD